MNTKNRNRLSKEKSPYLLQHATNPVDWYVWNDEAFQKAKSEDKPIFLSIGYSTCHWCHVMEKESFENDEVAEVLNDHFISIKVDREERPDVDNVYMKVCQAMTGSGGWPLTIVMTPEREPFFAATYIPREDRYGRIGLINLLNQIDTLWKKQRDDLLSSAKEITDTFRTYQNSALAGSLPEKNVLELALKQLEEQYDAENGGFGEAPKFPSPHQYTFLLRYWKTSGDDAILRMVIHSLQAMRNGGMYDHIGYGFHRYATDKEWLVPHFEKMLYDQASLALVFSETYHATKHPFFKKVVEEIFTYVQRDMLSPDGLFYSAEDADSEGEEGKFYVWSADELKEILGEDYAFFSEVFNVRDDGNFTDPFSPEQKGKNILYTTETIAAIAEREDTTETLLQEKIDALSETIFNKRKKRIHPHKDDKVLTDWNAYIIAAYAYAARVFENRHFNDVAIRAMEALQSKMKTDNNILLHRYRDNEAAIDGFLDDYAYMIYALLELYQTTFRTDYLKDAITYTKVLNTHFADQKGGYFFTGENQEQHFYRDKEAYDGAIASGNSMMMHNLLTLGKITGDQKYIDNAEDLMKFFSGQLRKAPMAYTCFLTGILEYYATPTEIIIAENNNTDESDEMLKVIRNEYMPFSVTVLRKKGENELQKIIS